MQLSGLDKAVSNFVDLTENRQEFSDKSTQVGEKMRSWRTYSSRIYSKVAAPTISLVGRRHSTEATSTLTKVAVKADSLCACRFQDFRHFRHAFEQGHEASAARNSIEGEEFRFKGR